MHEGENENGKFLKGRSRNKTKLSYLDNTLMHSGKSIDYLRFPNMKT